MPQPSRDAIEQMKAAADRTYYRATVNDRGYTWDKDNHDRAVESAARAAEDAYFSSGRYNPQAVYDAWLAANSYLWEP